MLIDEARISIKAGDGGNGFVHFYRDRWRPKGGPDGGNGGNGGSVYFIAVSDINKLQQFRHRKKYFTEDGSNGGIKQMTGKNGRDLVLEVPVGTIVTYDNGTRVEFIKVGEKFLMAKGGKGGKGNFHFRSATNQTPQDFTPGQKKDYKNLFIQLKLIAQVGLIGLPNAGKTSLLNELTSAKAKVANYAFTTLEPNLGSTKSGHIIADIPGLIEGASLGKGLGVKFLKHIERTQILVHCLSCESQNLKKDYEIVRRELESYSSVLAAKPEILVLTKSDILEPEQIKSFRRQINAKFLTSIIDPDSIKKLNDFLAKQLG